MNMRRRFFVFAFLFAAAENASAKDYDVLTYVSQDGSYEFDYPSFFHENHEFPDGTGDLDGIRSELEGGLESNIAVYAIDPRGVKSVTDQTYADYVAQYKTDMAPDARLTFISDAAVQMVGQMAADIKFHKKGYGRMHGLRFIATMANGKDLFVRCSYTLDAEDTFGPVCDYVASSLRLKQ
jgi:hypothetical protein